LGLEEYEDNKLVLNTVHDLMQFFNQSNCKYRSKSKSKDLRTCYEKLYSINEYTLSTLQDHLYSKGLVERIHGNTGRAAKRESKVFLDLSVTFPIKKYLKQYAIIHGLPSPMCHKNESEPFIYLSTGKTYTSVYNEFKEHFYSEYRDTKNIISYFTFRRLWHEMRAHLKFQPPASDLCEVCETLKAKLIVAKSNVDEYEEIKNQYEQHYKAAEKEREHYNNNINERNQAIQYNNGLGWTCNLSMDIGKVYASKESGGIEVAFQLLTDKDFNINTPLETVRTKQLTDERKHYLYTKIRQYVEDPFKDLYCMNPVEAKNKNK
ncbi:1048_t:CDS:2, partial [Racocetra persica]